jgi:hypothetical protein
MLLVGRACPTQEYDMGSLVTAALIQVAVSSAGWEVVPSWPVRKYQPNIGQLKMLSSNSLNYLMVKVAFSE